MPLEASTKVRVLIIGFGYVAQHLISAMRDDERFEVSCGARSKKSVDVVKSVPLDVCDAESCAGALWATLPDVVVNTAAMSSPTQCEQDEALAMRTNCPTALLEACFAVVPDALFVQFSTDLVLEDGAGRRHADGGDSMSAIRAVIASSRPTNAYGRSKLAFEKALLAFPRVVLLRSSNALGPAAPFTNDGKFVQWLVGELESGNSVELYYDEIRSFVSIAQIVRGVVAAVDRFGLSYLPADNRADALAAATKPSETAFYEQEARRTYPPVWLHLNVGGPEPLSRVHVGRAIAHAAGLDHARIAAIPRPDNVVTPLDVALDSSAFASLLGVPLVPVRDALFQDFLRRGEEPDEPASPSE
mmetsp:Transcript_3768/g.11663  ORF Transcript_3768/g.11663 Transcript_3768/m.11663 type:complete len:359 (+) Transcript_3768:1745-2821(+)